MTHRKTIVLGGGLSGLSVAHYLGGDTLVLEAEERPGGLCRSLSKDGFVYDIGGHILFSKNKEILDEVLSWLGDNVHTRERKNAIWYKGRFVKYPFENGLAALDKEEIFEILMTFLNRPQMTPRNLEEWCYARFGAGLAEKYLIPYNRKIWKFEPSQMSLHWVERIPSPPVEDIVRSAIGIETEGYTFQLHFHYPKEGGFESLIRGLVSRVPEVLSGFRVRSVRKGPNGWIVSDGARSLTCDRLVSTIPIFDLIECLEGVPDEVRRAVAGLRYNSLILVMLGVNHDRLADRTGLYLPDAHILPHRACYSTYVSRANAPEGRSHVMAEITAPPGSALFETDDDALFKKVAADLMEACPFTQEDIVTTDVKRFPYAYPVYDLDYQKNTQTFYEYLDRQAIYFTGRFAAFRYVNVDVCVAMAKGLALALKAGEKPVRDWGHL